MIDLRLLQCFVATAETEHVGRAAELLRVSQSPLSRQLQRLERGLGVTLFAREKKRIRLTAAGRSLVEPARALLERAERFEREAAKSSNAAEARVSLGCVKTALWADVVQRALRALRDAHHGVLVDVETMSSERQIEALAIGRIDVALLHRPPHTREMVVREIHAEPFVLALPKGHALAKKRLVSPEDLRQETWVLLARNLAPEAFDRLRATAAALGIDLRARHEVSDRTTQLALVEAALGVAVVPSSARAAASRAVVLREVPWLDLRSRIFVAHRRSTLSTAARALVDLLPSRVAGQAAEPSLSSARDRRTRRRDLPR